MCVFAMDFLSGEICFMSVRACVRPRVHFLSHPYLFLLIGLLEFSIGKTGDTFRKNIPGNEYLKPELASLAVPWRADLQRWPVVCTVAADRQCAPQRTLAISLPPRCRVCFTSSITLVLQ